MPHADARARRATTSRITIPPRTRPSAAREAPRSARPALLTALGVAAALTAAGLRLSREEARRGASETRHVPAAVRGDLVLRARDVPIPEGALDGAACAAARTRWTFPRATRETLAASLRDTLGDAAMADAAAAQARCDDEGCAVEPDGAFVEALSPGARARLHSLLGHDAPSAARFAPIRRLAWDVPFAATPGLPATAREAVARLTWEDQGARVFADLPAACAHVHTEADRRALVRAIHWPRTWEVALRTAPSSVERLVASFPRTARAGLRTALERGRAAGREAVPLEEFLPAGHRRLVGAWAAEGAPPGLGLILSADGARGASGDAEEALARGYERLDDERPRFGDVLVMRAGDFAVAGAAIHLVAGMVLALPDPGGARPGRVAPLEEAVLGMPDLWRVEVWRRRDDGHRGR